MFHERDCCESVEIEEIVGNLDDLLLNPILLAEKVIKKGYEPKWDEDGSCTWTFYKLGTIKGYVTLRWYGESSGYYSEEVDLAILDKEG